MTQNKALQILNFKVSQELVENCYKESKIDKLKNIMTKANFRFVYNHLKKTCQKLLVIFSSKTPKYTNAGLEKPDFARCKDHQL